MLRFKIFIALTCICGYSLAAEEGAAKTLQYEFKRDGDAQYKFSFETSNGIKRDETGDEIPSIHDETNKAALVKGSFTYPGADGKIYTVNYVADEAGFHPEGDHLKIPPFTPWIPGQPIDDGQYKDDTSGSYKPDNSGQYRPNEGEQEDSPILEPKKKLDNFKSGERLLSGIQTTPQTPTTTYLPTRLPQKTNYVSGENIYDTFLSPKKAPGTTTYLPPTGTPSYNSGENILGGFRESSRVTPKYLPTQSSQSLYTTENPGLNQDFLKSLVLFNKPTPHPDILLRSTPDGSSKVPSKIAGLGQYRPFSLTVHSEHKTKRDSKGFQFNDINPELRLLAGLIK
ncbi:uncharacterized protein LOC126746006 isoform X2 [Anthonomus grandis grandis]|uniref:uncharacterized protein LOC126746006 isoform X2 n=1 Tax=Anthonomus grandis grandis TaxID=2921223 RepID=UPI0021651ECC|nr:uncharacterized protein LOC126746006 isoform X2 [Anthonomus grandis grandis]